MGLAGFRERFRKCRVAAGLTQQQMAARIGVSIGTIACWELGRQPSDIPAMICSAEAFGVTLDWLLAGVGSKRRRAASAA